jgi:hypothetical protein
VTGRGRKGHRIGEVRIRDAAAPLQHAQQPPIHFIQHRPRNVLLQKPVFFDVSSSISPDRAQNFNPFARGLVKNKA